MQTDADYSQYFVFKFDGTGRNAAVCNLTPFVALWGSFAAYFLPLDSAPLSRVWELPDASGVERSHPQV